MAIKDRNLEAGTLLRASYKKVEHECRVEVDERGELAFVLDDGRRFTSASAAASTVMEGKAVNGWLFWSLAQEGPKARSPKEAK